MHSGMTTVPRHIDMDFDTMLGNHMEALAKLQSASKDLAQSSYGSRPVGSAFQRPHKRRKEHSEYALSQAHEGKELQYKRGPEDLAGFYDRQINSILFAWHVPPQVLGKNINSERLASSNRLSEAALHRYSRFIDSLRSTVSLAISNLSESISGSKQFSVVMYPCINEHTLKMVEPILKPEVARTLYSCIYGVPEEYFDMDKIRTKQDLLLEEQKKPGTRDRAPDSQDKKDDRMKKKAEKPSDE